MAAGITRDHGEVLREDVNYLAFTFVAPLCPDDYSGFASLQCQLRNRDSRTHTVSARVPLPPGRTRLAAAKLKNLWDESGEDVYAVSYRAGAGDGNAAKRGMLGYLRLCLSERLFSGAWNLLFQRQTTNSPSQYRGLHSLSRRPRKSPPGNPRSPPARFSMEGNQASTALIIPATTLCCVAPLTTVDLFGSSARRYATGPTKLTRLGKLVEFSPES